jgi:hypothetical protein
MVCARERHFGNISLETTNVMSQQGINTVYDLKGNGFSPPKPNVTASPYNFNLQTLTTSKTKGNVTKSKKGQAMPVLRQKMPK